MAVDIGSINDELSELSRREDAINQKLCNASFRRALFDDPVKILKEEGITLPRDREESVIELFKSAKVPQNADLRLGSDFSKPGISISIGIRIRF